MDRTAQKVVVEAGFLKKPYNSVNNAPPAWATVWKEWDSNLFGGYLDALELTLKSWGWVFWDEERLRQPFLRGFFLTFLLSKEHRAIKGLGLTYT